MQRTNEAKIRKAMSDPQLEAETARCLLEKSEIQAGLFTIWELDLLDESMEAEIEEALRRLNEMGHFKSQLVNAIF